MENNEFIKERILGHVGKYPTLEPRDLFKYIYQSAYGCEHFAPARALALKYIIDEYSDADGDTDTPSELLCGGYSRVHLRAIREGLSPCTLAALFCLSAKEEKDGRTALDLMVGKALELASEGRLPFSPSRLEEELLLWEKDGFSPVHHTESFKERYRPCYRVVADRYASFLPLFMRIDRMIKKGRVILAIEGGSASGKTTLSTILSEVYGCTVFHMDDFFLRPEQRTPERLSEVGGNVDRERFLAEVLSPLSRGEEICYRRFDCSSFTISSPERVTPTPLTVIEGAYSMHPELSDFYTLSVFLDISEDDQIERIKRRNTKDMAKRFFSEWIPLERIYFEQMNVKERCDLSITVGKDINPFADL